MAERIATRQADAACLRTAAGIIQARSRRRTFAIRVVTKVLREFADRIERQDGRDG